ncbi:MAG: type II toxin-antitoxin system VapC family toxin [Spirochaetaceae bacterium]
MVLDTTVCVDLLRETAHETDGPATDAVRSLGETRVYISFFSLCELETGVRLAARPAEEQARYEHLLRRLTVLYPDAGFPVLYGEAAASLISAGTPIPTMDLLIGITAKAHSLPLLTRDTTRFARIGGLVVHGY